MFFVGDVHGRIPELLSIVKECGEEDIIQIGDLGVGFDIPIPTFFNTPGFKFIRGNHDKPSQCRKHPAYLGDYGYLKDKSLFYVSGALSIDQDYRVEDFDWWREEEMSIKKLCEVVEMYHDIKPKYVVTHDCPELIMKQMFPDTCKVSFPSRTGQAFDRMFEIHQPDIWIFGHHHITRKKKIHGTMFHCVGELDFVEIDI